MATTTAFINFTYRGTPLIRSPMGQKNLAVLTGDHINEGIFTRKCMAIWPSGQNIVAVITMLQHYRDSSKTEFHCIYINLHITMIKQQSHPTGVEVIIELLSQQEFKTVVCVVP